MINQSGNENGTPSDVNYWTSLNIVDNLTVSGSTELQNLIVNADLTPGSTLNVSETFKVKGRLTMPAINKLAGSPTSQFKGAVTLFSSYQLLYTTTLSSSSKSGFYGGNILADSYLVLQFITDYTNACQVGTYIQISGYHLNNAYIDFNTSKNSTSFHTLPITVKGIPTRNQANFSIHSSLKSGTKVTINVYAIALGTASPLPFGPPKN